MHVLHLHSEYLQLHAQEAESQFPALIICGSAEMWLQLPVVMHIFNIQKPLLEAEESPCYTPKKDVQYHSWGCADLEDLFENSEGCFLAACWLVWVTLQTSKTAVRNASSWMGVGRKSLPWTCTVQNQSYLKLYCPLVEFFECTFTSMHFPHGKHQMILRISIKRDQATFQNKHLKKHVTHPFLF